MKSVRFAYLILILLLGALGYVTYIKFTYKAPTIDPIENKNPSIALSTIADNYNTNNLYTDIKTEANINGTNLDIKLETKDVNTNYTFTYTNGILKNETPLTEPSSAYLDKIFVYLVNALSKSSNDTTILPLESALMIINNDYQSQMFKYMKDTTNVTTIIDTTKQIDIYKTDKIYTDIAILDINNKNYSVNIFNTNMIITNAKFKEDNKSFVVDMYINKKDINTKSVLVLTLYDIDKKELKQNTYSIEEMKDNLLKTSIELNLDTINKDTVKYYSVHLKEEE